MATPNDMIRAGGGFNIKGSKKVKEEILRRAEEQGREIRDRIAKQRKKAERQEKLLNARLEKYKRELKKAREEKDAHRLEYLAQLKKELDAQKAANDSARRSLDERMSKVNQ